VPKVTPTTERQATEPDVDRFYRRLAHDAPDAIIYADAEGVIGFWNSAAERIFGFSAAEAIGKPLDIIIPQNLRKRHWHGYRETVRSGKSRYGAGDVLAVPALRKDGVRISVEFTILPFRDKTGRTLGMAATLRDVTKRFEEIKILREAVAGRS
jgi:PAS domain S-box-containing protein